MRGRLTILTAILLVAALAGAWAAHASDVVRRDEAEPGSTRAAAFDQTFQRVVGPASLDATRAAYDADL